MKVPLLPDEYSLYKDSDTGDLVIAWKSWVIARFDSESGSWVSADWAIAPWEISDPRSDAVFEKAVKSIPASLDNFWE